MPARRTILAENIRVLREASDLTQGEFGEKFGGNQKTQWTYEKGAIPSSTYLLRLCNYYSVHLDTIQNKRLRIDREGTILNGQEDDKKKLQQIHKDVQVLKKEFEKVHGKTVKIMEQLLTEISQFNSKSRTR
jgi:transcriptional regulator with XRE-family HTH domain